MRVGKTLPRALWGWVALVAGQVMAGIIVSMKAPAAPHVFAWTLVADVLIVAALGSAAMRSDWRGLKLGLALYSIPFVLWLTDALEGVVFLKPSNVPWLGLTAYTAVAYGLAVPLWVVIFTRHRGPVSGSSQAFSRGSIGQKLWGFAASDFAYAFLYLLAGTIVFPFVRAFYATQSVPPLWKVVALQLVVRGPVLVLICLCLLRLLRLPRSSGAFAVGAIFAILSGFAPLLIPNPFLPDSVRWAHLCEVTSSNFLFAGLVAWIWGKADNLPREAQVAA